MRDVALVAAFACGLAFVALDLASDNGPRPGPDATDAEIVAFWEAQPITPLTWASLAAEATSFLLFLVFASAITDGLAHTDRGARSLARAAHASAVVAVAVKLVEIPFVEWIHHRVAAGATLDPPVTAAVDALAGGAFELGWAPAGAFLLLVGILAVSRRTLPAWLAWGAIVDGAGLLVGFALPTFLPGIVFWLGFLLWCALASATLARAAWRGDTAGAHGPIP